MEQREKALREALVNNAEETARWESYKEDNGVAVENLNKFSNFLTLDVMVPIGRKAYMPGHLIHTNEVLVGHYQNYFSKCSAHKAKQICEHRIKMAEEHLDKLKTECNLWQNKLDKPYSDGVFPSMENHEIIENYDEAEEKIWREKHKIRVKQAKAQERAEREQSSDRVSYSNEYDMDMSDSDIFKLIEQGEIMEELYKEMDNLDIDEVSNETIKKLMAGEMKLPPEKTRIAHVDKKDSVHSTKEKKPNIEFENKNKDQELQGHVSKREFDTDSVETNDDDRPDPRLVTSNIGFCEESVANDDLSREIQTIKEQAKFLPPLDQIVFYEFHIKIWRQKFSTLSPKDDIDQMKYILNVLEALDLLIEKAEDTAEALEEEEIIKINKEKPLQRRVSFALENETLEFRKDDTISEMLKNKDVIELDENDSCSNIKISPIPEKVDRKKNIIDKVEKNLRFIEENQSTKDFQLVDTILESSSGACYTLRIKFQHSAESGNEINRKKENFEDSYPGSPSDVYEAYLKNTDKQDALKNKTKSQIIYPNAYSGEDMVKVSHMRERDRENSYVDQRLEFCKPTVTETKSIIRNKAAAESEKQKLERKNDATNYREGQMKKATFGEEGYMSAYYKVMNKVVEKPLTEPDPLPEGNSIDVHTPKKRISRFKQTRKVKEKL